MKYKRVIISKRGGPEVLKLIEDEIKEPKSGEVRIKVKAAGVAFADIFMREGLYPGVPPPPVTPGYDVAGIVDEVGGEVKGLEVGQAVVALTQYGGYAEMINFPANWVVAQPPELNHAEAVSLVLNYLTAYQMLHRIARIREGERILIHGAAGGVGTALLQLGVLMNLEMYGTASKNKHPVITEHGGIPIDYRSEDFIRKIQKETANGVDAVFDPIGGKNGVRSFQSLRAGGRIVAYGFSAAMTKGRRNLLNAATAFVRSPRHHWLKIFKSNRGILGYSVWNLNQDRPEWYQEDLQKVLQLLQQKKIKPVIGEKLPLSEASKAHELMNNAKVIGKIVLMCE